MRGQKGRRAGVGHEAKFRPNFRSPSPEDVINRNLDAPPLVDDHDPPVVGDDPTSEVPSIGKDKPETDGNAEDEPDRKPPRNEQQPENDPAKGKGGRAWRRSQPKNVSLVAHAADPIFIGLKPKVSHCTLRLLRSINRIAETGRTRRTYGRHQVRVADLGAPRDVTNRPRERGHRVVRPASGCSSRGHG